MLTLRGRGMQIVRGSEATAPRIFRLSDDPNRPTPLRRMEGYISRSGQTPDGFAWYVMLGDHQPGATIELSDKSAAVFLPQAFEYIADGDILRVGTAKGDVAVLFQQSVKHHSFLLTERCNHYCLMCSQPPRDVNDDWIFKDIMDAIPLIDRGTRELSFTGGEPTLLGDRLVDLSRQCQSYLPSAGLHVLTNGRAFNDIGYAKKFQRLRHFDLMFGIPIYSDLSERHDHVVQADGAFDETIRGILNLKSSGLRVDIRVVVHKQTYDRLPDLARFLARNLTFVDQVVFMGLEMTGFTRANLAQLWIDPIDYQPQLLEAVKMLTASRMHVAIYNHQLCVLDPMLWSFAKRSISDWKNEYMPECDGCAVRPECGGFFSSAKLRYSDHIRPIMIAA